MLFHVAVALVGGALAQITGASRLLTNAGGENARYSGIGRFLGPRTSTAFFVEPPRPVESAPAYAITAGHCIDLNSSNEVIRNRTLTNARVIFHYFHDTVSRQITIPARTVVHSTMKGRDLAIVELAESYGGLTRRGIRPLALPESEAREVVTIGAPYGNTPAEEAFLRSASCELGPPMDLIEHIWHFFDSLPNDCSDVKTGSSGSAVIARDSGHVVAVMNTTTAGATIDTGDFPCYSGQPCQVVEGGFVYHRDTNYAVPLAGLTECFRGDAVLDPDRTGCPLDPGRQFTLSAPLRAVRPGAPWDVRVTGDAYPRFRYKVVREGFGDCRNADGYGPLQPAPALITDPLPAGDARYYLCVLGGDQPLQFATMVHTRVDTSPPTIPISVQIVDRAARGWTFQPIFVLPELVQFYYKVIEAAGPTCADQDGYRPFLRVPIPVPASSFMFCLFGGDQANNMTPVLEYKLRGPQVFPPGVLHAATLRAEALAPGTAGTVMGVNFANHRLQLTDSAGTRWPVEKLHESAMQINFVVPAGASLGDAMLEIDDLRTPVRLESSAPGIFTARSSGFGPPAGFAVRVKDGVSHSSLLSLEPVNLPEPGEELFLDIFATGLDADARALIAGVELPVIRMGLYGWRIPVPRSIELRGYLPLEMASGGKRGNVATIRLR